MYKSKISSSIGSNAKPGNELTCGPCSVACVNSCHTNCDIECNWGCEYSCTGSCVYVCADGCGTRCYALAGSGWGDAVGIVASLEQDI